MKLAISQINTKIGDFSTTARRMRQQAADAAAAQADLIVFPAPTLTGVDSGGLSDSEDFVGDLLQCLQGLAEGLAVSALVPVVLGGREGRFSELMLIRDGTIVPLRMLSSQRLAPEGGSDVPAIAFELPQAGGTDVRIAAAMDRDDLAAATQDPRADLLLYLPTDACNTNDEATFLAASVADGCFVGEAREANAWFVAVGASGGYAEHVFGGGSFVMAPWGELLWAAPSFEETFAVVDIDLASEGPLAAPLIPPSYQRIPQLWDALVVWCRDFVDKGSWSDVALVLEGDLGSSVLAALLTDALGPTRVHALIAPAANPEAAKDAAACAHNLRLAAEELPMRAATAALSALGATSDMSHLPSTGDVARLKLAFEAREHGWALASAADKTALALEADTLHVGQAQLAPLADVYRSDVVALARWRNTRSPVIERSAQARFSVPELPGVIRLGRSAEARLSALDAWLLLHIERRAGVGAIAQGQSQVAELVQAVLERVQLLEPYRRALPPLPYVSDCAFPEREWPYGLAWYDRARDDGELASDAISRFVEELFSQSVPTELPEIDFGDIEEIVGMLRDFGFTDASDADAPDDAPDSSPGYFSEN